VNAEGSKPKGLRNFGMKVAESINEK